MNENASTTPAKRMIVYVAGDVSLRAAPRKAPLPNPLSALGELWQDADEVCVNLETALAPVNNGAAEKAYTSITSPDAVAWLKEAKVSIVALANNHVLDAGDVGMRETLAALSDSDIRQIGIRTPTETGIHIAKQNGITVGLTTFYDTKRQPPSKYHIKTISPLDGVLTQIAGLAGRVDWLVVQCHWGIEKVGYPTRRQIRYAQRIIDAGADVVLGHHPHVIQGCQHYHDALIVYSLGNCQFEFRPDQCGAPSDPHTDWGVVARFEFTRDAYTYRLIPIVQDENFCPHPADAEVSASVERRLERISEPLRRARAYRMGWWFRRCGGAYLREHFSSHRQLFRQRGAKHIVRFLLWLIRPFTIRSFIGMLCPKASSQETS